MWNISRQTFFQRYWHKIFQQNFNLITCIAISKSSTYNFAQRYIGYSTLFIAPYLLKIAIKRVHQSFLYILYFIVLSEKNYPQNGHFEFHGSTAEWSAQYLMTSTALRALFVLHCEPSSKSRIFHLTHLSTLYYFCPTLWAPFV